MLRFGIILADLLPYHSDTLRSFPQSKALGKMTQMNVPPVEDLAHVARVARVEPYPGGVR